MANFLIGAGIFGLAFFIIGLIPESERWKQSMKQGGSNPFREIFGPKLRRPT